MTDRDSLRVAKICLLIALLCFVYVVALESRACAADLDKSEAAFLTASLADLASTEYVLRTCAGCREANPLMQSTGSRVMVKTAAAVGTITLYRTLKRDHPKAAKIVLGVVTVGFGGLAIRSWTVKR